MTSSKGFSLRTYTCISFMSMIMPNLDQCIYVCWDKILVRNIGPIEKNNECILLTGKSHES